MNLRVLHFKFESTVWYLEVLQFKPEFKYPHYLMVDNLLSHLEDGPCMLDG